MHKMHYDRGILAAAVLVVAGLLTVIAPSVPHERQAALGGASQKNTLRVALATTNLGQQVGAKKKQALSEVGQKVLTEHLAKKYSKSEVTVARIVQAAYKEAGKKGVSPLLVLAVIEKESSLRPTAANSYGAKGLMQVVPKWHPEKVKSLSHPEGLLHPESNIKVGTEILAEYLNRYSGDLDLALKRYSGSARNYAVRVKGFQTELESVLKESPLVSATAQVSSVG